jgi:hypothetical protein
MGGDKPIAVPFHSFSGYEEDLRDAGLDEASIEKALAVRRAKEKERYAQEVRRERETVDRINEEIRADFNAAYIKWHSMPWWRKMFSSPPSQPSYIPKRFR